MSLWLADELHVSLSPTQVGVVRVQRRLGLRGARRRVVAKQSLPCDPNSQAFAWGGALRTLDTLLPQCLDGCPNVVMVLSNHFVHYALVPWSDLISSDEEQLDYARHCFQMTYGATVATWALRLSRATVGASQLASAVDEQLLVACNEAVTRHGLRLTSVQPYFMSAFNRLKCQIHQPDAWVALAEPGCICLARLHQGQWIRFRAARLANGWAEFARFLVREAFMGNSELQAEEQVLYVYAAHFGGLQTISGWNIFELSAPLPPELPEEEDTSLVMALSGQISG
ncbi:MAG: hypothetical protein WAW75_05125 [Gallionella sp.]